MHIVFAFATLIPTQKVRRLKSVGQMHMVWPCDVMSKCFVTARACMCAREHESVNKRSVPKWRHAMSAGLARPPSLARLREGLPAGKDTLQTLRNCSPCSFRRTRQTTLSSRSVILLTATCTPSPNRSDRRRHPHRSFRHCTQATASRSGKRVSSRVAARLPASSHSSPRCPPPTRFNRIHIARKLWAPPCNYELLPCLTVVGLSH